MQCYYLHAAFNKSVFSTYYKYPTMLKKAIATAAILSLLTACNENKKSDTDKNAAGKNTSKDSHTQANADSVTTKHLMLNLKVDFDNHQLSGNANWQIENTSKAKEYILDTDGGLQIDSVFVDGKAIAGWYLGNEVALVGKALHIPIEVSTKEVNIQYRTGKEATALKWLTPQQTSGKKYPFLYTQSEATFARTWVPCPDGPGIRFIYDARVEVPKELLALMSAENPQARNDSGIYTFKMDKPIPAYLLAIAVGDLRFAAVNERTGVYAEPDMIGKASWELAEMGKMVDAAEKLYGPYRWGRYDVLVLPPSFPIGGMENPKLTFCTPTIIAGDRSLTNLIAHELAHNWSGNLVTSATWDDIWMNEGFTVYLERRITEAMMGQSYVDMLWELGYQDLVKEVNGMGKDSKDTWLKLNMTGRSADDALSDIPYEKGSLFLCLIEKNVGREKFDGFLEAYFDRHAFKSITTEQFVAELKNDLIKDDSTLARELNINAWVYGPGIPENAPRAKGERFAKVEEQRAAFLNGTAANTLVTKDWTTHEWLHFLRGMPKPLTIAQMNNLDGAFQFTNTGNSEIADLWYERSLAADYTPAYANMEQFISRVGRRKFLEPLYREMMATNKHQMAKDFYKKYRDNYHPLAQDMVANIINGK